MRSRTAWLTQLNCGVLLLALTSWGALGRAAEPLFPSRPQTPTAALPEIRLPLNEMPADVREKLSAVLDKPALTVRGPIESFECVPTTYHWLLANPDRGVVMWRKLGAQCVQIHNRGNGVFGWNDNLGSELSWSTVYMTGRMRVIYANGQVKPGMLLPKVAVQAVVVVHYTEDGQGKERTGMKHQAEMAIRTESKAISAAARLMGASAQRVGEQYMGQLQMFYSGMAWYLDQHPDEAPGLLQSGNGN